MQNLVNAFVRFGWAMSLFGVKLLGDAFAAPNGSARAQFAAVRQPAGSAGSLEASTFIVIGDGLASGMADFALTSERQRRSFPSQLARQMGTAFAQRPIEPPGLGNAPGFQRLPVRAPAAMQATVLERLPESEHDLCDFTVPGLRIADVLTRRPAPPLVWRDDATQTTLNLILGMPALRDEPRGALHTILERATGRRPTLALICLGFDEVLDAATSQNPARLPAPDEACAVYEQLVSALAGAGAQVVVVTIPNPLSTAYFSSLSDAAAVLRTADGLLEELYGLDANATITVPGLVEIGNQLLRRAVAPLSDAAVLDEAAGRTIAAWVAGCNRRLQAITTAAAASLFDLTAWLNCFEQRGATIGTRSVTARYLGGFYSLNGYYPGATGHALIANAFLDFFNARFGASFPAVNLEEVIANDPAAMCEAARGPVWTAADLRPRPDRTAITRADWMPPIASGNTSADQWNEPARHRLTLPPGLVQTLPLCKETSYFGEAIRAVDCSDARESTYGTCAGLLFNGLVLTDSHLSGRVCIRFTPPDRNITHFELTLPDGLVGEDSALVAPCLFEFPFVGNRLTDFPGVVSSGDLDLATGEVTNLSCAFGIATSGLTALASVNPAFPRQAITFPGQYGSAIARFTQRPDGLLDVAFYGTTFLPLGGALGEDLLRFPLPFAGPSLEFASIPARGTVMHPHVCLNTADLSVDSASVPQLPENTIREYTLLSRHSSFGDRFTLHVPELGGQATGRSHLTGRAEVQFGARSGNSVPFVLTLLGPGGLLKPVEPSPITEAFPGRLSMGPLGYDEFLRFPLTTYFLEGVSLLDDPFDISVGAVDLRSGWVVGDLLHRGFIDQDVFLALLRIEPRTPRSSFRFCGAARFEGDDRGTLLRFKGHTSIPYPAGFRFPQPDLASPFVAGPGSVLDPFLWLRAAESDSRRQASLTGADVEVTASNGECFSYEFAFDSAGRARFEYTNVTQGGSFHLQSLNWIDFARSRGAPAVDTVSFSGFGVWSKDGVDSQQQASAHISTASNARYVGILIGGGAVSNVNTKPSSIADVIP